MREIKLTQIDNYGDETWSESFPGATVKEAYIKLIDSGLAAEWDISPSDILKACHEVVMVNDFTQMEVG